MNDKSLDDTGFTALDIETTGLSARYCGIVEIAALKELPDGSVESFQTLVDPQMLIPEDVIAIHGITNEMVRGKPIAQEAVERLVEFVGESPLVIHNAKFDLGFLTPLVMDLGLKWGSPVVFDTVRLSKRAFPRLTSYSLENLSRHFGFEKGKHHRALADCYYCARLFHLVLDELDISDMTISWIARRYGETQFLLGR